MVESASIDKPYLDLTCLVERRLETVLPDHLTNIRLRGVQGDSRDSLKEWYRMAVKAAVN